MKLPKIVYDNIIFSIQSAGGISVYWAEICKRINENKSVTFLENKNTNSVRCHIELDNIFDSLFCNKKCRYFPFIGRLKTKSFFHSSYYRTCFGKNVVNIITVYDFTYERYFKGLKKYVHIVQKLIAILNADAIITISNNTKEDLYKYYPFSKNKLVKTIYLGIDKEFHQISRNSILKNKMFSRLLLSKYILFVGSRAFYKNFEIAVEVASRLGWQLVIVGGNSLSETEEKILSSNQLSYEYFNFLSNNLLNYLYNNAFCLIYPSSYEGFGLPIIEAMKAGCPVVCSNNSSLPEASGDAALLVDDLSPSSYINSIKLLLNTDFRAQKISKGLTHAKSFTWDNCYINHLKFYQDVEKKLCSFFI